MLIKTSTYSLKIQYGLHLVIYLFIQLDTFEISQNFCLNLSNGNHTNSHKYIRMENKTIMTAMCRELKPQKLGSPQMTQIQ